MDSKLSTPLEPSDSLQHFYGVCERLGPGMWEEPLNVLSNFAFIFVAYRLYKYYHKHPDLEERWILDIHFLTFLIFIIGGASIVFHAYPTITTELFDAVPIFLFINAFFFSVLFRIGKCNLFQATICYIAFAGFTHMFISYFPRALNDSIGYLSTMVALGMIAVYLHLKARPSSQYFLMAALVGVASLFFRSIDNAVCDILPIGTHFMWHILNALLIFIVMKQLIRNVNREARLKRLGLIDKLEH